MRKKIQRILNLLVSVAWFALQAGRRSVWRLAGGKPAGQGVVFCYHAVAARHVAGFDWQMRMLRRHATPVAAGKTSAVPAGVRWAAVTFDDGHRSVIDQALPVLRRYAIPATIFFISDLLGQPAPWAGLEGYEIDDPYLSAEGLAMLPDDLLEAGSHTCTHPRIPSLAADRLIAELADSRSRIAQLTGRAVKLFAFPYGALNAASIEAAAQAGYERVFSVEPRPAFRRAGEFVVGRVVADPKDWKLEFLLKLHGGYDWRSPVLALRDSLRQRRGSRERLTVPDEISRRIERQRG